MPKVRVWIPFEKKVPYIVDVENTDLETVKQALLKIDPSDWECEPNFFEALGSNFKYFVRDVTEEDITMPFVNLVVKVSKGVVVEGYSFNDAGDADDKADDLRNSRGFNENEDDVCVIYDVPIIE